MNWKSSFNKDMQNDPRTTEELIKLALAEEDRDAWLYLVGVLHFRGNFEVFQAASRLCKSENPQERRLGTNILGQLGIPKRTFPNESLAILLKMLETDDDPDVLSAVGIALGHIKYPRSIEPLVRLKDSPNADVCYGVVFGLLSQEDELAIDTLSELSSDPDEDVRNWATFGLGSQIETDSKVIREALFQRLIKEGRKTDTEAEIRGEALVGLAKRKDERVVNPLIEELSSGCVGRLPVEAAKEIGDVRLYPVLIELKEWWDLDSDLLEEAINNCKNKNFGSFGVAMLLFT
ncbi:HEAT repeat domain-containing protein [Argonema antarcticum]|uniref:HEAT repeat domain-containing protein n=1 Tax=Argonema antarcticum TaxID=2942763 RepID=UPI0020135A9B|nr:HEAT repeat domain-containing protein [Argonema antarcticum]MCL1469386.1 HEAT repeat domain-containing protein [Argonema antarcticum A004/B2]